jgi:hypothetical protein
VAGAGEPSLLTLSEGSEIGALGPCDSTRSGAGVSSTCPVVFRMSELEFEKRSRIDSYHGEPWRRKTDMYYAGLGYCTEAPEKDMV